MLPPPPFLSYEETDAPKIKYSKIPNNRYLDHRIVYISFFCSRM